MAVKIRRERPDQRRHHRVTAPLFALIAGHRVRAADWSLGGLRIEEFPGTVPEVGEEVPLHLTLPFQGFDVSFDAKCLIVRSEPEIGSFRVRFTEIGERERELMGHFIEELIRGSMVDIEDTIQRIDAPVTPASLVPDVNPVRDIPISRRPTKTIVMSAIYLVLGAVVFAYAGLLAYSNFFRLEVQTAVITAPVEQIGSHGDGRIIWTGLKAGDAVKAGQIIVNVEDNVLEREIQLAAIAIEEAKAKLTFARNRLTDEAERAKGLATMEMKNLEQARLDIEGLTAQLHAAESQLARLGILYRGGFTTLARMEECEKLVLTLRKSLEGRRVELKSRVEVAENNLGRRFFAGDNLVGEAGQFEAQIRLSESEVATAEQRHKILIGHRDRLAARAPFDGTLLELPHVNSSTVKKGDTVAVIEQRQSRLVTAFLTQDEVLRVGIGDEVKLYVPALGETLQGRVRHIDRTTGFVEEQKRALNPGYRWRGPVDRSAKVTIDFAETTRVADQDRYRSGLPIVVIFPQHSTNSVLASLRQRLALAH